MESYKEYFSENVVFEVVCIMDEIVIKLPTSNMQSSYMGTYLVNLKKIITPIFSHAWFLRKYFVFVSEIYLEGTVILFYDV